MSTAHRSGRGSVPARARRAWRDVRLRWREFDVEALSPRIASAVFLIAGLLALCAQALLPSTAVDDQILPSALAAVVLGVAGVVATGTSGHGERDGRRDCDARPPDGFAAALLSHCGYLFLRGVLEVTLLRCRAAGGDPGTPSQW